MSKKTDWNNFSFCIRIAGNTEPRSLMALHMSGYAVRSWCDYSIDTKGNENYEHTYEAKKDERLFSASSPVELLGLVALWEIRGDNWQKVTPKEWEFYEKFKKESIIYDPDGNDITDE